MNQIAATIYAQLGGRKFAAMVGANGLCYGERSLTVQLGSNPKRIKALVVKLDDNDTYTMEFWKQHRFPKMPEANTVSGVYFDQLVPIFEDRTGLLTSL